MGEREGVHGVSEPLRFEPRIKPPDDDGVRWLAMLIRQGLKLIVAGIEQKYGLDDSKTRSAVVK